MVRKLYETILRIRIFEDICVELFGRQKIKGVLYTCHGEEAIPAGVCLAITKKDFITTYYRGHGYLIARKLDPEKIFREILGMEGGYANGNGGTMHIVAPEGGVMDYNAIVGAQIPIGVGLALSIKYKKENRVVITAFGDGATATGFFHEAVNLASVWRLPIVFICHNNQYAETTPYKNHSRVQVFQKAAAYGIDGLRINGNDAVIVYKTVKNAVKKAKAGRPQLIECITYRLKGHYIGEPERYRTIREVKKWIEMDPVKIMEEKYRIKDDELKKKIRAEYEKILEIL